MARILEIPIEDVDSDFEFRLSLEDDDFVFRIYWNTRSERWHLSISDSRGLPILMGIPLNVDTDFLKLFRIPSLPKGILTLHDSFGKQEEASLDSLGQRHLLLYQESE